MDRDHVHLRRPASAATGGKLRLEYGTRERAHRRALHAVEPGVDFARTFPGMADCLDQRGRPQCKIAGREQVGYGCLLAVAARQPTVFRHQLPLKIGADPIGVGELSGGQDYGIRSDVEFRSRNVHRHAASVTPRLALAGADEAHANCCSAIAEEFHRRIVGLDVSALFEQRFQFAWQNHHIRA